MSQTTSNIRPRILLTINKKSTGSIDELRIIILSGVYTRTAGLSCYDLVITATGAAGAEEEMLC